jgi:hypothetical protein
MKVNRRQFIGFQANQSIRPKVLPIARVRAALLFVLSMLPLIQRDANADQALIDYSLRGYLDARVIATDDVWGWRGRGLGKTRYGADGPGDRRFEPRLAEAGVMLNAQIGWSLKGVLDLKFDDAQRYPVDINETYLRYRSGPHRWGRIGFRAGSFFPPVSLEHRALGWTSPYAVSASAINTWIGEEIRVNGGELTVESRQDTWEAEIKGSIYFANDPAGALLAWRGWSIGDRKLGLLDKAPLPASVWQARNPYGPFRGQSDSFEPLHEIDGRAGFYLGGSVAIEKWLKLEILYYDNNADPEAKNRSEGQYAWHTVFANLGMEIQLPHDVSVLAQYMDGFTDMGTRLPPLGRRAAEVGYDAAYILVSKKFGRHRLTVRYDYFATDDNDTMKSVYLNDEYGQAIMLAYVFKPQERRRLTLEALYVDSERSVLSVFGQDEYFDELEFQLSYRVFF